MKEKIDVKLSHIPFSVHTYILGLSDINPENIDRLGIYRGTVIKCTQTKSLEKKKVFRCTDCGTEYECEAEIQSDNSFRLPPGCENLVMKDRKNTGFVSNMMRKFNLAPQKQGYGASPTGFEVEDGPVGGIYKKKREMCNGTRWEEKSASQVHVDYQEIKIQEQFETIKPGKIPSNMWVILENSLVDKCSPGDDVLIVGVPTPRIRKTKYKERPEAQLVLVANTIQLRNNEHTHGNKMENKQTPNEAGNSSLTNVPNPQSSLRFEKMFELYWKEENRTLLFELETRNNIIESLCPHLFGKLDVKLAMLLTIIGGVTSIVNNTRIRGQSHMLIIGEPGTGKSQLLRGAHELSYRAVYTNGIGSTSAGLTVSLSKEGNEWMMEAGALVISDLGICCIDEFNLIKNQDYKAVHEAMEQQTVSMSKAGLYCKVNTRASILAACNPVTAGQKYNTAVNYMENSGLTSPLISRFDIVFVMTDKQTDASKSAEYVLNGFKAVKKQKTQLMSAYMSATSTQNTKSGAFPKEVWSAECVREYIRHIQVTIQPLIEDDADRILREYFKHLRNITTYGQKTVRTLESLVRLTQAHARLMHRDRCTIFDAVSVIVLMESASSTGLIEDAEKYIKLDSEEDYNEVEAKVLTPLGLCFAEECEIIEEGGNGE